MNEPPKSLGQAISDVLEALFGYIRAEIRHFGEGLARAVRRRGLGVLLLAAALLPILAAIIFVLLAIYQALTLALPPWLASLVMAILALALAAVLVAAGLRRLGGDPDVR